MEMVTSEFCLISSLPSSPDSRRVAVRVPDHGERVPLRRHRVRPSGLRRAPGLVPDRGRGPRRVQRNRRADLHVRSDHCLGGERLRHRGKEMIRRRQRTYISIISVQGILIGFDGAAWVQFAAYVKKFNVQRPSSLCNACTYLNLYYTYST